MPTDPRKLAQALRSNLPATIAEARGELPLIPKLLLDAMDKLWPERSPFRETDTIESLMWQGGQRSVVRKLISEYNRQNDNLLNR